jgi:hypothetical protein
MRARERAGKIRIKRNDLAIALNDIRSGRAVFIENNGIDRAKYAVRIRGRWLIAVQSTDEQGNGRLHTVLRPNKTERMWIGERIGGIAGMSEKLKRRTMYRENRWKDKDYE